MPRSDALPTLRRALSVPYLVEAVAVEDGAGNWLRRASHPELPDCWAETARIERTLELLHRRRVEVVLGLLRRGVAPPCPRPPLPDADPEGLLLRCGLHARLAPLLDLPATALAQGSPDAHP